MRNAGDVPWTVGVMLQSVSAGCHSHFIDMKDSGKSLLKIQKFDFFFLKQGIDVHTSSAFFSAVLTYLELSCATVAFPVKRQCIMLMFRCH